MCGLCPPISDTVVPSDAACAEAHSPEVTVVNCSPYAIFLPKNAFFSKKICVCAIFVVPLHRISIRSDVSRSRAVVARQAHNLKVGGSIPPSATREKAAL